MSIIENAELVEITLAGQRFKFPFTEGMPTHLKPPCNCITLSGWNRATNVQIGDTGRLFYRVGKNYGLYFFEKYPAIEATK